MSAVSVIRFPMTRREDAEKFMSNIDDYESRVDENGLGGTIDIYAVSSHDTIEDLARPFKVRVTHM